MFDIHTNCASGTAEFPVDIRLLVNGTGFAR